MKKVLKWILWILLGIGLILIPKIFGIYYTNFFVMFAIMAVFSQSINLELGYTRILNFGHAMFYGMGGYAAAQALVHIPGMPIWGAVLCGLLGGALLALVLSPLVVRVSGMACAMLHVAFNSLFFMLANKLRPLTGGEDGIGGFPTPAFNIPGIISIDMKNPLNFYYFAVAVLGLSMWLMWYFTKTPFGQIMLGIRDNPKRVNYLGFKVPQSKALVYVVGGAFAGVSGSMYALFQNLFSSDATSPINSFSPVLMTMVGGIGTFLGPILGTLFYQVVEEVARHFTERIELVMGLTLIIVILFAPMGFMGIYLKLKLKARWGKAPSLPKN
jgi:branched-chain amino acid transport system permease protein